MKASNSNVTNLSYSYLLNVLKKEDPAIDNVLITMTIPNTNNNVFKINVTLFLVELIIKKLIYFFIIINFFSLYNILKNFTQI